MGKYMKKAKSPGEVGVKDASRSSLGVRTRSKTLAQRRLRCSAPSRPSKCDLGYLELRSRRLVRRPPLLGKYMQSSQVVSFVSGENGGFGFREECSGLGLKSGSVGPGKREDACLLSTSSRGLESRDLVIEASFGENNSESGDRDRTIPGPTMEQTSIAPATEPRSQNTRFLDMPTTDEIEEFFTREEQLWQRLFIEKYNFDVVNDLPLPGRCEWVKKSP